MADARGLWELFLFKVLVPPPRRLEPVAMGLRVRGQVERASLVFKRNLLSPAAKTERDEVPPK